MYDQEAEINALRDAIISGEVKEFDGVITGDHVQFPVQRGAKVIFVRPFYPVFVNSFFDSILNDPRQSGMIVQGPSGIGKSYMAMYFLYKALKGGYNVVYEQVQSGSIFMFPQTGKCRVLHGKVNECHIDALGGDKNKTIHLFDNVVGSNCGEPFQTSSKVVIFTCPNQTGYQYIRNSGADTVEVPSYTKEELDKRRKYFTDVSDEDYHRNLTIAGGGTIRWTTFNASNILDRAVACATLDNVLDILDNRHPRLIKGNDEPYLLFSSYLRKGLNASDIMNYEEGNFIRNISSKYIMQKLFQYRKDYIQQFVTKDSSIFQQRAGLEPTAALLFASVASYYIAQGGEFHIRRLDTQESITIGTVVDKWDKVTEVDTTDMKNISIVLEKCTDTTKIYNFIGGNTPGIDAWMPPNKIFQYTVNDSHIINLNAVLNICKHLKKVDTKLQLYFAVPPCMYDTDWITSQPFQGSTGSSYSLNKLEKSEEDRKLLKVSRAEVDLLKNKVVQYAMCLDLEYPPGQLGSVRKYGTLTGTGVTRTLMRGVQKFLR